MKKPGPNHLAVWLFIAFGSLASGLYVSMTGGHPLLVTALFTLYAGTAGLLVAGAMIAMWSIEKAKKEKDN